MALVGWIIQNISHDISLYLPVHVWLPFQVLDVVAQGAFGNVLKVRKEEDKRLYAMKVTTLKKKSYENILTLPMLMLLLSQRC